MSRKKAINTDWDYARQAADFAGGRKTVLEDAQVADEAERRAAKTRRRNGPAPVVSDKEAAAAKKAAALATTKATKFKVRAGHDVMDPLQSDEQREVISKSEAKRRMEALQGVADSLIALRSEQLKLLQLPDELSKAVKEAQVTTEKTAKRRAAHFVGKVIRKVDADPIIAGLARLAQSGGQDAAVERGATLWREKLLAGTQTTADFWQAYPLTEAQLAVDDFDEGEFHREFDKLVAQAKREAKAREKNPDTPPKLTRELYRRLREQIAESGR